jgi:hypothetical protein
MNIILIISTIILPIMSLQIFTFQTPIIYDKDDLSVKSNSYPITFKDTDPKGSAFEMLKGVKHIKPKLCINCKHFITDNDTGKFGKCSLFPKKEGKINFLVNGVNDTLYYYCSISRELNDMCGEEGKFYTPLHI